MKTPLLAFYKNAPIFKLWGHRLVWLLVFLNIYILRLHAQGIQWDKTLGGDKSDQFSALVITTDGGSLIGGTSSSNKSADKSEDSKGGDDYWIVKLRSDGTQEWDKTIGGSYTDNLTTMQKTQDGGYILGGWSYSDASGDKSENNKQTLYSSPDYWVVKLNANGSKEWDKTIGGNGGDELRFLQQTRDGGYILGGTSNSDKGDDKSEDSKAVDESPDYWVVKLNADGSKAWDKTLGGNDNDDLQTLLQTPDGGYLLGGFSSSHKSGDKSDNAKGADDYWIVKLLPDGTKAWDKTIGSGGVDQLTSLQQTPDGGYMLGGYSNSGKGEDKTVDSRDYDFWLVKLQANGTQEWDKTIGGTQGDYLRIMQSTSDGGFLLAGFSESGKDGDKTGDNKGSYGYDYWIVKVAANGTQEWDKTIGGYTNDILQSFQFAPDGGYMLGGYSNSQIGGDKTEEYLGGEWDYWVVKVKEKGTKEQIITFDPIPNKTLVDRPFALSARASSGLPVTLKVISGPATIQDSIVTITGMGEVIIKATQAGDAIYLSAQDVTRTFQVEGENPVPKQWDKILGGNGRDVLTTMATSSDGGYLLGGYSASGITGDKSQTNRGGTDYWIVKINSNGSKTWDKTFGGSQDDNLSAIIPTPDGGYLLGGTSASNANNDKSEANKGRSDYWVVKIDAQGVKQWDKTFGGSDLDFLQSIVPTSDGGYLLGGYSYSDVGGDKSNANKGDWGADYWVVKIDQQGQKTWDKTFGGSTDDILSDVVARSDNGYLLGGYSSSGKSGDKSQNFKGGYDYWVIKIDSNGKKLWDKTVGGDSDDRLGSLTIGSDGSYLLGGYSESHKSSDKSEDGRGSNDYWLVKLDATGKKIWDKTLGGESDDRLSSLLPRADGSCLLGGSSASDKTGDKSQVSRGSYDYWLVKVDTNGKKLWDRAYGGNSSDFLNFLVPTADGYVAGGWSQSDKNGDQSEANNGDLDYWILNVKDNGKKEQTIAFDVVLNKTVKDKPFLLSAQSTSGLPVQYGIVSGPAKIKDYTVTLTGTGQVTVKATQAGNANYLAQEVMQDFLVEPANPVTKIWEKAFGGSAGEIFTNIIPTPDGGYLLGGTSSSGKNGDKSTPGKGSEDYWIVKIDNNGTKIWDKTFGGTSIDELQDLIATPDGGYLLGGTSSSGISGDKTEASRGSADYWLVKIDAQGKKQWDKTFGGNQYEYFRTLVNAPGGGYLLGGVSESGKSGDKSQALTGTWLVKMDANGNRIWDKSPGHNIDLRDMVATLDSGYLLAGIGYSIVKIDGTGKEEWHRNFRGGEQLRSLIATMDGGYLLGGISQLDKGGDKTENNRGINDYWVVKVNATGNKEWDKTIGGAGRDELFSLLATSDGGYLLGGYSASNISGEKSQVHRGSCGNDIVNCGPDYWVVKITNTGQKVWDKTIGGKDASILDETITAMVTTPDGGYLLAGYSNSDRGGDKSESTRGFLDYWVVKIKEEQPNITAWNMRYGGTGQDNLTSVIKTYDGGYLSGGYTNSGASGDKTQPSQGQNDYWIVKSDKNGQQIWDKRYGGSEDDYLNRVIQTQDGGYLLAGSSLSGKSGDKSQASKGNLDYWLVKTDAQGNKEWDKTYGGSGEEELVKVIQLRTGEYVLGGHSNSPISGDKTQAAQGGRDYWLIKISKNGTLIWDQRYGGSMEEKLGSFIETPDGGYLLGGSSLSGKTGDKSQVSQGASDYWVVKTDKNGKLVWEKTFGGNQQDQVYSVGMNSAKNYFISGTSSSGKSGNKTQASQGGKDYWLVTLDEKGTKLWDRTFGGSKDDELRASTFTSQGHYVLAGHSSSEVSGDKTQASQGESDYWIVEVDQQGNQVQDLRYGGSGTEELRTVTPTKDGGLLLAGRSNSGVSGDRTQTSQGSTDYWLVKVAPQTSPMVAERTATLAEELQVKSKAFILQAYPNPFQGQITIRFSVETTQPVNLTAYDSEGRKVVTLFQGEAQAKHVQQVEWQAKNQVGGLYFLRLQTDGKVQYHKVLLTR
ncbi:T9SS type A sorting domain-containing protein [Adhaeribacter pallidiroseus]|uniref:Secretion system C-terminal sorting domain-containing protein n=1 Tax=Adhaeribacter pallidiroseus TaxID=2072847 RepID=A0A369QMI0_9BACT|nr:T9SS type A sorting domain-containing protein [Adhaeribacter pallidiroseus]RDC64875.1 hypothetical protein AHMF7616_03497 [Adhaeribacter pallidiroseus]